MPSPGLRTLLATFALQETTRRHVPTISGLHFRRLFILLVALLVHRSLLLPNFYPWLLRLSYGTSPPWALAGRRQLIHRWIPSLHTAPVKRSISCSGALDSRTGSGSVLVPRLRSCVCETAHDFVCSAILCSLLQGVHVPLGIHHIAWSASTCGIGAVFMDSLQGSIALPSTFLFLLPHSLDLLHGSGLCHTGCSPWTIKCRWRLLFRTSRGNFSFFGAVTRCNNSVVAWKDHTCARKQHDNLA